MYKTVPEQLAALGNDFVPWCMTADDLLTARDTLREQRNAAYAEMFALFADTSNTSVTLSPEGHSLWIEAMLLGFAIENLLKALWLRKGNKLYVNGKMVRVKELSSHDLARIADHVGFAVSANERGILEKLSNIMTGIGRYPVDREPKANPYWDDAWDAELQGMVARLQKAN